MGARVAYDVAVVGGGPGGYVAAIRATQLGLDVVLIEEKHLGGICLNWGCIPTKALLKGAEVAHTLGSAAHFGFSVSDWDFDLARLVKHSRDVSSRLSSGIEFLMKKNKVTVIDARARIIAKERLALAHQDGSATEISAKHIILATGARPRPVPGVQPDGEHIWTYFEAMTPAALPDSLLVIGSGAIGVEFASFYNDMGVDVTLVEALDQLLPNEDPEVATLVSRSMGKRGIECLAATRVEGTSVEESGVVCTLIDKDGERSQRHFERVLLAAGVVANSDDLGLEALGIETDRSFIRADQWCRTNLVGIYAIGDVSGPPCLAHKASHEAIVCVEHLAGVPDVHPIDKQTVPGCTYCRPQIASMGMTEKTARENGRRIRVGRFDLQANGKALAMADSEGFVKVIFDELSGELLGAHMVGPEVTEQLQGFGVAHSLEATVEDLAHNMFAHPTISEAMHEAVLDAQGRVIHA
ncbi:MAG: dihydrolipoyl dehydrogenase [Pseudomonadota bacterium]